MICVGTLGNHNVEAEWYWIYRKFYVEVWWYLCDRSSTCSIGVVWMFYMRMLCTRINRVIVVSVRSHSTLRIQNRQVI